MSETYRVLIADDNTLARQGIAAVVAGEPDFAVVGEADDGDIAVRLAQQVQPDLVLMDINMPRCDGLVATRLLKRTLPQVTVVILTVSDDALDLFEAIKAGAQGYLLKNLEPETWVAYLRGVMRGETPIDRALARRILQEFHPPAPVPAGATQLTPREEEVLRLVAGGASNREIALALRISENTVKNHIKNILEKLHLKNRVQLAGFARDSGLK